MTETQYQKRRPAGMGIAARFTLGLGLLASIFASIAAFVLLQGIQDMGTDLVDEAQREMVAKTVQMQADEARRGAMEMKAYSTSEQIPVQVGVGPVTTSKGEAEAKVFLANRPARPNAPSEPITMYAPSDLGSDTAMRVLALVVLVCGALVAATVIMGALTARRLTAPLNEMVEDVLAISRGHLDRQIGGEDAVGEVAHLAVAMDRMVDDLVESQENQEALAASEAEAENLRELRRHLQPMRIEAPAGWSIEACLIEAGGAGTGDFVDAMDDGAGHMISLVGAPATHGMPGALLMAMTRAYLRSSLLGGAEPSVAFDAANTSLNRDLARGLYCSVIAARVDTDNGHLELVSAGHQAPAVRWDAEAGQLRKLQPNGIALGFDQGPIFRNSLETMQVDLKPGDALLLFSPLAFECTSPSGKQLGEAGVYQLAKLAVSAGLPALEEKLTAFLGGEPESDLAFSLVRHLGAEA
ncbi:MAG: PP2C family protein-serine/threonine phosphatase [Planctomycetota bacterium]